MALTSVAVLQHLVHPEIVGPDRLHVDTVDDAVGQRVVGFGERHRRRVATPGADQFDLERRSGRAKFQAVHRRGGGNRALVVPQHAEAAGADRRQDLQRQLCLELRDLLLPQIGCDETAEEIPARDRIRQVGEGKGVRKRRKLRRHIAGDVDIAHLHGFELLEIRPQNRARMHLDIRIDIEFLA